MQMLELGLQEGERDGLVLRRAVQGHCDQRMEGQGRDELQKKPQVTIEIQLRVVLLRDPVLEQGLTSALTRKASLRPCCLGLWTQQKPSHIAQRDYSAL